MSMFDAIDGALGSALEKTVMAHHRRRLGRRGWRSALDPSGEGLWAEGATPPREGCDLTLHVDGAEAIPRIVEAIQAARRCVHIASWWLTPSLRIGTDAAGAPITLRELLASRAQEGVTVRVLQWAGFPIPGTPISRTVVRRFVHELVDGTPVQCRLDTHERPLHCHHEKAVVVDGDRAFVGGIDITDFQGDRRDSSVHPDRGTLGWHDALVELRGPIVADIARHFAMRWSEAADDALGNTPTTEVDPPDRAPTVRRNVGDATPGKVIATDATAQLVRTVPERVYRALPRGEFSILESYVRAIRAAREFVYLENQFLWSPEIARELCRKLHDPPTPDFRLLLVLPVHPQSGGDDTRGQLGEVLAADDGAGRVAACGLYARTADGVRTQPHPVYVHAKIAVVDDRWMTIGSANLNEHSLFNDSELNVICCDAAFARDTRLRLWSEHLECTREALARQSPREVVDTRFVTIGREQRALLERGEPLSHRLVELPDVSARAERLLGPLEGLLVDG